MSQLSFERISVILAFVLFSWSIYVRIL
jgi:hypothetical protein